MDAFVSRKRRKISKGKDEVINPVANVQPQYHDEAGTDEKLAMLASIFEDKPYEDLLDALLRCEGSTERAIDYLLNTSNHVGGVSAAIAQRKVSGLTGIQSALRFGKGDNESAPRVPSKKSLTRKGKTLFLYSPKDISRHTPCTVIHNFLPSGLANGLIEELLPETETFSSATFRLFDNVVKSPHTACFYVESAAAAERQRASYLYNGSALSDIREIKPLMREVSRLVQDAVNDEIKKRIATFPDGKKLAHQPPLGDWIPNAAFVNCYDGAQQSVGYHTDQLTYLGPHPTIGSLSLGVQREFRIRRIVPPPDPELKGEALKKAQDEMADAQGQISLPLPHNSLLIMHADMQETWKHSIAPAGAANGGIVPHPIAGRKRLNITYRWYREEFEPRYTPKCRCKVRVKREDNQGNTIEKEEGMPCVLKSVMRREATRGKYVWMCQTPGRVGEDAEIGKADGEAKGCGMFEWAEFDDDGVPLSFVNNTTNERWLSTIDMEK